MFNRACIVGAGAIGGWIGAGLVRAGCDVSVVARGQALAAIQAQGLRLQTTAGPESVQAGMAVRASAHPAELGVQDLVVIAVKAPSLLDVARSIAPLMGPDTVVLTAMNGVPWWFFQGFGGVHEGTHLQAVDATGGIAAAIPPNHIVGCVVHASCALSAPGVVQHHFGNKLIVGEPSGLKTPRVVGLAELLTRAGFEAPVSDQIQRDTWYKLWGNMTVNPISALTGATTDLILGDPLVRSFVSSVMLEAKEIGARIGIPIDQRPEDRHAVTLKLGAFKTSMLQDIEAGKAVELDALVSVVRELGVVVGVATPFTDALLGLARLQAQVRGLYQATTTGTRGARAHISS
jgi:2-dehydropantoate 2-reductase